MYMHLQYTRHYVQAPAVHQEICTGTCSTSGIMYRHL
jgi:hypothetical protein